MYILYGGKFTRAIITEKVLAECGLEYELRPVDTVKGDHRSPEYLKINPAGWVPALITPEGETLYETPAINLYLAERHGTPELAPAVGDPDRGLFLSGFFYVSDELEHHLKRYWFAHRYADGEKDAPAVKQRAYEQIASNLQVIDGRLAEKGPYHLGARYSLVDLVVAHWAVSIDVPDFLDSMPALRRCCDLVHARPHLKSLLERQERWMEEYYELNAAGGGVR